MADGYNNYRAYRVLEITADREMLLNEIANFPSEPQYPEDRNTDGYTILRRCDSEAVRITGMAFDTSVCSSRGGPEEQKRRQYAKNCLDAYSRRHAAQKVYNWHMAARRWLQNRAAVLQGERPQEKHRQHLAAVDQQLRRELASVTDESVFQWLRQTDIQSNKWVHEDPSLSQVLTWLSSRR